MWGAGTRVCVLMSVSTPDGEPRAGGGAPFAPAAVSPERRGVGGAPHRPRNKPYVPPSPCRALTQFAHQGKGETMTAPDLFAEHTEGLERKVVFKVSSKPRVIILWPLLFLRLLCWLGSRAPSPGP